MELLVTGATGFIAGHLVPALARAGHHVYALGHDPVRLERFRGLPGIELLTVDLSVPPLPIERLPARLDAIVHLAQANVPFPSGAGALFEVNTGSTQRLLDYARRTGAARFIFASSGSVYGGGERPWTEDDCPNGTGFYAATKLASERFIQAYGEELASTILRLFTPYGPGQQGRLVPALIDRVVHRRPVQLREGGRPRMNPIFVDHVVDVVLQALGAEGSHLVNVAGDEILSIKEMAEIIGRQAGCEPVFEEVPGASGGDVVAGTARLRRTFRLPPRLTSFATGVQAMLSAGHGGGRR